MKDREIFEKETGIDIESCITQDGIDPVVYKYIEWLEKRSEWVSVEDRLPDKQDWYLVKYRAGIRSLWFNGKTFCLSDRLDRGRYIKKSATKWKYIIPPDESKRGRG